MLTETEHLLTKLAEECNEVAQRCTKALCFGLSEVQPGQDQTNAQRIATELDDLYGVASMLVTRKAIPAPSINGITAKKARIALFMGYARSVGALEKSHA